MFLLSFINNAERPGSCTDRSGSCGETFDLPFGIRALPEVCRGRTTMSPFSLSSLFWSSCYVRPFIGNRFRRERRNVNNCINDSLRLWRKGNAEKERKEACFPFFSGTMTTPDRRSHSQFAQAALFVLFSGLPGHCYCFVCFWDLVFLRHTGTEVINLPAGVAGGNYKSHFSPSRQALGLSAH